MEISTEQPKERWVRSLQIFYNIYVSNYVFTISLCVCVCVYASIHLSAIISNYYLETSSSPQSRYLLRTCWPHITLDSFPETDVNFAGVQRENRMLEDRSHRGGFMSIRHAESQGSRFIASQSSLSTECRGARRLNLERRTEKG